MSGRSHWRGCQEWRDESLPMAGGSNEACKIFDAALTQYVGWYSDENAYGGLMSCCETLVKEHNDFAMGQVMSHSLALMSRTVSPESSPRLKDALERMKHRSQTDTELSEREKLHMKACCVMGEGDLVEASRLYEDIIFAHPTDMFALRSLYNLCYYMGHPRRVRNAYGRVIPYWKETIPLYGYLFGTYGYGLCETGDRVEGEKYARKGLSINPSDMWSIHAMSHIYEETERWKEGREFYRSNEVHFGSKGMSSLHLYWHMGLFSVELGDTEEALGVYDSQIYPRGKADRSVVDPASYLLRLEMDGVDVGDRWEDCYEIARPHLDTPHLWAFDDAHITMALVGVKKKECQDKFLASLKDYAENCEETNQKVSRDVGMAMAEAVVAYGDGRYGEATELLLKKRYRVIDTGGSDAQRDVFNILMISSAMKSADHHAVARQLLFEREANRPTSPLTERMTARLLSAHSV